MRLCPICGSDRRETLYAFATTYTGVQLLYACVCGMIYASTPAPDYSSSIYSRPASYGSGETDSDRERLDKAVAIIYKFVAPERSILDVGCARGGMLEALRRKGFSHLYGLDPSPECTAYTSSKGFPVFTGTLSDVGGEKFDALIMSHVLEHIEEPKTFLGSALAHLNPGGYLYIEVPDTDRHDGYAMPFLEFNSEHINHFNSDTLTTLLESCGFSVGAPNHRVLDLAHNVKYPVMSVIANRRLTTARMMRYVNRSAEAMSELNKNLSIDLAGHPGCIVWGAGEYFAHVAELPIFQTCPIMQVIDSNMYGRSACGFLVEPPSAIRHDLPIVISALTAAPISIKADIRKMELPNPVFDLRFP